MVTTVSPIPYLMPSYGAGLDLVAFAAALLGEKVRDLPGVKLLDFILVERTGQREGLIPIFPGLSRAFYSEVAMHLSVSSILFASVAADNAGRTFDLMFMMHDSALGFREADHTPCQPRGRKTLPERQRFADPGILAAGLSE